ncbi:hypothetical protein [Reticulibacter mediterranei]|uniref:hypothetical protein n=1 Tax=Reticulibacter mediterranei TaxID=2778369 RepID=UPI001C68ED73|nr:hypothetical protein [Reticulibacter mediterranei]
MCYTACVVGDQARIERNALPWSFCCQVVQHHISYGNLRRLISQPTLTNSCQGCLEQGLLHCFHRHGKVVHFLEEREPMGLARRCFAMTEEV